MARCCADVLIEANLVSLSSGVSLARYCCVNDLLEANLVSLWSGVSLARCCCVNDLFEVSLVSIDREFHWHVVAFYGAVAAVVAPQFLSLVDVYRPHGVFEDEILVALLFHHVLLVSSQEKTSFSFSKINLLTRVCNGNYGIVQFVKINLTRVCNGNYGIVQCKSVIW